MQKLLDSKLVISIKLIVTNFFYKLSATFFHGILFILNDRLGVESIKVSG